MIAGPSTGELSRMATGSEVLSLVRVIETFLQKIAAQIDIPQNILDSLARASITVTVIRVAHSTQRHLESRRRCPAESAQNRCFGAVNIDHIGRAHTTALAISDIDHRKAERRRFRQTT